MSYLWNGIHSVHGLTDEHPRKKFLTFRSPRPLMQWPHTAQKDHPMQCGASAQRRRKHFVQPAMTLFPNNVFKQSPCVSTVNPTSSIHAHERENIFNFQIPKQMTPCRTKLRCNSSVYGWPLTSGIFIQFQDLSELRQLNAQSIRWKPFCTENGYPSPAKLKFLPTLSCHRWRLRTMCDNHQYWFNIAHRSLPPFDFHIKSRYFHFRNSLYILIVLYHLIYKMSIVFLNFY